MVRVRRRRLRAGPVRFDRTRSRGVSGRIFALRAALDDEGMGVGELDAHVFLGDARQLAVEFVGVGDFFDIEAGLEGADGGAGVGAGGGRLGAVGVVVVEEAEEGGEVRVGGQGLEEGGHGARVFKCGLSWEFGGEFENSGKRGAGCRIDLHKRVDCFCA